MSTKHLMLLIAVLSISACASVAVEYDAKSTTIAPDNWASFSAEYQNVEIDWLKGFEDPLMLKLIREGRANNLDLNLAASNMDKAWLLASKSATSLKPKVDLALGQTSKDVSNVQLTASWEVDIWGRIRAGVSGAESSAQAVEADYLFAQQSLSASIAKSYFKVVEASLQTNLAKNNRSVLQETLRITKAKYDNGLSSGQDLALNRANLAVAEEQVTRLQGAHRDAMRALEVLLGRYPNASIDLASKLPALPDNPPAGIPSSLLERRPDIISAERKIAAAFSAIKETKAAALPSFSLTGSANNASDSLSSVLNPSDLAWQLGANLLVPLFDGGRRKLDIEIANLEQKQAVTNYAKVALKAFSEVENNLDQGLILSQRESALIDVQEQSNKAYRIAKIRYDEGEIDLLETLTIQKQANTAESNLLSVKRNLLEQRINLYLSLGGSWAGIQ